MQVCLLYTSITRQFTYHDGKVTDEHKNNEKIMSGPVTNLVKRIVMSDGRIPVSYTHLIL